MITLDCLKWQNQCSFFLCLPGTCCGVIVVYIVSRDYCYLCYILVVAAVAVVAGDFVVVGCYLWLFSTPRYT